MRIHRTSLLSLFLFAACNSDHPLAGNWSQELPGGAKGMSLELDAKSDKVFVHTAPRPEPDGGHDHLKGTYTWDAATKAVTVKALLAGDGKADTWTGTVDGDTMQLGSADGKLSFRRGGKPDGH